MATKPTSITDPIKRREIMQDYFRRVASLGTLGLANSQANSPSGYTDATLAYVLAILTAKFSEYSCDVIEQLGLDPNKVTDLSLLITLKEAIGDVAKRQG